jgi:hypothetical protein
MPWSLSDYAGGYYGNLARSGRSHKKKRRIPEEGNPAQRPEKEHRKDLRDAK